MSFLPPHVSFPDEPALQACPACASAAARRVYAVRGIPTHSCVLLDDQEAARSFHAGDLALAHCPDCGFLFNDAFDPRLLDYSEDYEETQGCSATFSAWLEGVIDRLVERTDLAGGTLVEVGCGRGDFLAQTCRSASCAGVGIDPSATAGRVDHAAGRGLRFLHERYGASHADLHADVLACRHTLEHLAPVAEVAALFHGGLEEHGGHLFVEVPDTRRILEEGAFWDLYYEHCSYFSAGSLGRLFKRSGFALDALEVEYGGQYLQLTAHPGVGGAAPLDDLAHLAAAVKRFTETCRATLARWHGVLEEARSANQTLVLWGSGSKATGFLTTLGAQDTVRAVVDINPAKHGRFVAGTGHRIVAPGSLTELQPDRVVIMNPVYRDEIQADLDRLGVSAQVDAV